MSEADADDLPSEPEPEVEQTDSAAIDAAWKIHGAVMDWTGKVDAKASFALAIESAAIVAAISLSSQGRVFSQWPSFWLATLFWIAIAALLTAASLAIAVVTPRLRRTELDSEWRANFIYFGHLRHWDSSDLAAALRNESLLPIISTQIVNMSAIAWRKHRQVQLSLILAGSASIALLLLAAVPL